LRRSRLIGLCGRDLFLIRAAFLTHGSRSTQRRRKLIGRIAGPSAIWST
jgi:hypothetical protein